MRPFILGSLKQSEMEVKDASGSNELTEVEFFQGCLAQRQGDMSFCHVCLYEEGCSKGPGAPRTAILSGGDSIVL